MHRILSSILNSFSFLCWVGCSLFCSADIVVDTSQDGGYFGSNPTAFAALNAAVSDLNSVINFNLSPITNDIVTGSSGGSTVNFDFSYNYGNPSTGSAVTIDNTRLAANEFRIFVGAMNLPGNTLGQGGPSGSGFTVNGSTSTGNFQAAVDMAMMNDQHNRGSGPTMSTLEGMIGDATFSFPIGPTVGALVFNSSVTNWQFDHTTAIEAGKNDFYSVALHEVIHSLGLGTSDTWDSLVDGNNWTGSEVIAERGSGLNLIVPGHITNGVMSARLSDGVMQEVVMDPDLTVGTRKLLTRLDVAFLRDLGYSTNVVAIPEPGSLLVVAMLGGIIAWRRYRS